MIENLSDNNSIHSNDKILKQQKKILNLFKEDYDINDFEEKKPEMKDSKTLPNIHINNNIENNKIEQKIVNPNVEKKTKNHTINAEKNAQNNEDIDNKRKKVGKLNRNLKILKIIKERMKERKFKSMFEEEKKEINKIEDINKEENLDNNNKNKEDNPEKNLVNNIENKEEENKNDNIISEEEKKSKLLNIISSKKYNKFQRRVLEDQDQEKNKNKIEVKLLSTDFPKLDHNIYEDNIQENIDNISEIKKESKSKDSLIEKIAPSEKKEEDKEPNEKKEKKEVSEEVDLPKKKGALKIVELLKMRKKDENENLKSAFDDEQNVIESDRVNRVVNQYSFKIKKKIVQKVKKDRNMENSLPKKNFKDEEMEGSNNFDFKNRTQHQFRVNNDKSINAKGDNYFNLSNNIINPINANNNVSNNTSSNNYQNVIKINKIKYKNPIGIKNNISERIKNFYSIKNENQNNLRVNYNKVLNNKKIMKAIDSSSNINNKTMKIPISKTMLNKSLVNSKIYKPKKISGNNSPLRYNLAHYERNTINTECITNNLINNLEHKNSLDNKKIKKVQKTYIKKSPEKYIDQKNSINNNTIGNNFYNKKTKKLINTYRNSSNFSTTYNRIFNNSSNMIKQNKNIFNLTSKFNYNDNINDIQENKTIKNIAPKKTYKEKSMLFNLEDLMVLEERLTNIISAIETNENIDNKCFNFWNYYYNCSLYNILDKVFKNKDDSNIARLSINYKLLSIMVCYEYSFEIDPSDEEIYLLLLELMDLNHYNLIIISEYILTKVAPENKQNIWVLKLQQVIKKSKELDFNKLHQNNNSKSAIEKISLNINFIIKSLKNILLNFPTNYSDILISLLKKIDTKTYDEINDFFREYILRVDNFEGPIVASSYLKKNKYFKSFPAPYILSRPIKQYTLVLDLDETLVHFKMKSNKGGTLKVRPYLYGFLEEMGHYYELIIWTSATEAYANSLIEAIEYEKQYFDYIFFREHAIIIGDDFVKDLNRIGRPLDSIIIIDDMPQNFRLQKENGITIKPYFGDDTDDSALYELVPILKHIAEEGNDVRIGLEKYREEIVKRVTSNISKQNF